MEELWGLAAKPGMMQFLTCGTDRHIFCWDSQAHTCVWMKEVSVSTGGLNLDQEESFCSYAGCIPVMMH